MSAFPKMCIVEGCSSYTNRGSRCRAHEKLYQKERNARPERQAYSDPMYRSYVKDSKCAQCGSTEKLTKDHIIPLDAGGDNSPENLQTLCLSCNDSKHNKVDDEVYTADTIKLEEESDVYVAVENPYKNRAKRIRRKANDNGTKEPN